MCNMYTAYCVYVRSQFLIILRKGPSDEAESLVLYIKRNSKILYVLIIFENIHILTDEFKLSVFEEILKIKISKFVFHFFLFLPLNIHYITRTIYTNNFLNFVLV